MILGECRSCSGWVVNPTTEKCAYCYNKVAPLPPLVLHDVQDGTRVDVQGSKLFGPDGAVLYDRQVSEDPEDIQRLRKLLHAYDEGVLPSRWVRYEIDREVIKKLADGVQEHGTIRWFTSSCCSSVPPTETVKMELSVCGSDITATRIDD
jgi:hypothetical protein